ncbi:MAG: NAD(P)-dependent oxidoreductase [Cyanobacteria bacterium J06634_5]
MNILITGGTGFIGSRLTLRCLADGHSVTALGQVNTPAEEANKQFLESKGAKVRLASVTEPETLPPVLEGIDTVFHLAAAQHEANVPEEYFRNVNVTGTKNVIEASIKAGVNRFVHGSTIGVYGLALDGKIDENSSLEPDNIYGVTKLEGEKLVLSYADQIEVVAIRISETYGPGDRRLLKLFKAIQKNLFFRIGSGKNKHHLIYIDDLIDGMLAASLSDKAAGEIVLLAGKEVVTTDEMIDAIASTLDQSVGGFHVPVFPFLVVAVAMETTLSPLGIQPPIHRRRMDFFRKSFLFSLDKSSNVLGFNPKTGFTQGAQQTAQWYKENELL